jgi:F-box protein 21
LQIVRGLDLLASDFSRSNPDFAQLTIRGKAIALLAWLRSHQRVGLNGPESGYRNLRNCLLGQALLREGHCSIPIMSCAIYSCVAQRLGLDAAPVSFPAHVRVMVSATPEMDLDGGPRQLGTPGWSERMFLDPFGSDQELPQTEVRMIMRLYNIFDYPGTHDYTWLGAEPANLVQRNAHNIIETSNQWAMRSEEPDSEDDRPSMLANLGHGDPETNIMTAAHAGLWALVFSTPFEDHLWRDYYKKFLGNIVTSWNDEAWLLEKYVLPLDEEFAKYDGRPRSSFDSAADTLRFLRNRDQRGPTVHRRYTEEINRKVKYRVGQVFRHARYRYIGIIVGWDPDGRATFPGGNYSWTSEDESSDERGIGGVFRHLGAAGRHPTGVYYQCL